MEDLILKCLDKFNFIEIVCLYVLFDVNKSLKKLSDTIEKLSDKVDKIEKLENQLRELKFKIDSFR